MNADTIRLVVEMIGAAVGGIFGSRAILRWKRTGSFEGRLEDLEKRVTEELDKVRDKTDDLESQQGVDRRYVQRFESRTDEDFTVIHEQLQLAQAALHRAAWGASRRRGARAGGLGS